MMNSRNTMAALAAIVGSFAIGVVLANLQRNRSHHQRRMIHKENLRTWEGEGGSLPTGPARTPHVV